MTFIATKFSIAYLVFPFVLLEFQLSLKVYYRMYFIGHLVCLVAIFVMPRLIRMFRPRKVVEKVDKDKDDLVRKEVDHVKKD